jgi:hypothetical protein
LAKNKIMKKILNQTGFNDLQREYRWVFQFNASGGSIKGQARTERNYSNDIWKTNEQNEVKEHTKQDLDNLSASIWDGKLNNLTMTVRPGDTMGALAFAARDIVNNKPGTTDKITINYGSNVRVDGQTIKLKQANKIYPGDVITFEGTSTNPTIVITRKNKTAPSNNPDGGGANNNNNNPETNTKVNQSLMIGTENLVLTYKSDGSELRVGGYSVSGTSTYNNRSGFFLSKANKKEHFVWFEGGKYKGEKVKPSEIITDNAEKIKKDKADVIKFTGEVKTATDNLKIKTDANAEADKQVVTQKAELNTYQSVLDAHNILSLEIDAEKAKGKDAKEKAKADLKAAVDEYNVTNQDNPIAISEKWPNKGQLNKKNQAKVYKRIYDAIPEENRNDLTKPDKEMRDKTIGKAMVKLNALKINDKKFKEHYTEQVKNIEDKIKKLEEQKAPKAEIAALTKKLESAKKKLTDKKAELTKLENKKAPVNQPTNQPTGNVDKPTDSGTDDDVDQANSALFGASKNATGNSGAGFGDVANAIDNFEL